MTRAVCAHRPEPGGLFTPCFPCTCSAEVIAQLVEEAHSGDVR